MSDAAQAMITIRVPYHQARALRSAALAQAKRMTGNMRRKNFIPEPGRINRDQAAIATLTAAAIAVDGALTQGIASAKG